MSGFLRRISFFQSSRSFSTPWVGAYGKISSGSSPGTRERMVGRKAGVPPFVAMPIVALALVAPFFASADWATIPLGKYRRLPRPESNASAMLPARALFNSFARAFMHGLYG